VTGIHDVAVEGFTKGTDAYERARPSYPPAAVAFVVDELGIGPASTVVDLAAGTGKLSRPLAATGARVIAVEPIAEMRALIGPPIEAVDGTAEEIPLPAGSADALTVAQAFHWFDGDRALAEIYRVLREGGGLALMWNRRHDDDELTAAVKEIIEPHRAGTPRHRSGHWRTAFERTILFGPLVEQHFSNSQELDADGLAMRFGSVSFVAALPDRERSEVDERLRALAADGPATITYVTELFTCRRL
jgi:SAM-dependent methyltransferase